MTEATVTLTLDTSELRRAMDACKAVMGICSSSPLVMQLADEARRNGELMERAMWLTGETATEIRAQAAESPLCFADFVATLATPPPITAPAPPALPTPPIVQPFVVPPPVAPVLPNPTRYRTRLGVVYCTVCDLAVPYCRGHAPPDAQSADGADSSLRARIAECSKGK